MVQNILDYLEASAAECPDKAAFEDLEASYTYAQVVEYGKRIGSALAGLALLGLSFLQLISSTANPFIYYRF